MRLNVENPGAHHLSQALAAITRSHSFQGKHTPAHVVSKQCCTTLAQPSHLFACPFVYTLASHPMLRHFLGAGG